MKKNGKRLIAFVVFFAALVSFLPLNLKINEKKAEAAGSVTYSDIQVQSKNYNTGAITVATPDGTSDYTYEFSNAQEYTFIGVTKGEYLSDTQLKSAAGTGSASSIVDQRIKLKSINGIDVSGATDLIELNNILKEKVGCTVDVQHVSNITEATNKMGTHEFDGQNGKKLIGLTLKNLPYGVNRVGIEIIETTRKCTYDNTTGAYVYEDEKASFPSDGAQIVTIYHASDYINSNIDKIKTTSYVGLTKDNYNNQTNAQLENNTLPFKYNDYADKVEGYPLRYKIAIPDSTKTLEYELLLNEAIQEGSAKIFLNGEEIEDTRTTVDTASGTTSIRGEFKDVFAYNIMVIKFTDTSSISKAYAIEIASETANSNTDFRLRSAELVKYEYENDDTVKAYIGKEFTRVEDDNILTYEGVVYIDPRAKKISINPQALIPEDKLVYIYKGENPVSKGEYEFVDFSGLNREIIMDGYYVKDGQPDYSNIAVRYIFHVDSTASGDVLPIELDFGNTAYLARPGDETKIDFNEDRYTYNLFADGRIDIKLKSPSTDRNEYIRVYTAPTIDSSQLTEVNQSALNYAKPTADRESELTDINVGTNQKMIVRVYYDEIKKDNQGNVSEIIPSQIGHEYCFYIAKNIEEDTSVEASTDATLKDLTIEDAKLKDANGNKGFYPNVYSYTAVIDKDAKTAVITPFANKDVESITAVVKETGDEYDMESGEETKIPLNESGNTTVTIKVLATDKVTSKTYTVVITNSEKSSDCRLQNLIVSPGDYDFNPDKDTTKVRVDLNVKEVDITPIASEGNAKIYINDKLFVGGSQEINLRGEQETEVEIEVVSEDGTKKSTHTVIITRRDEDSVIDTDEDESDVFYDEYGECWVDTSKYDEWGTIKGKDVYFDKQGRQVKDSWITTGKNGDYTFYYLNDKGYKYTGWLTDSTGAKYFLNQETGAMQKGYLNDNNTWFYFDPLTGKMKTGWLYVKEVNNWKYFLQTGQMVANTTMTVDGKTYDFDVEGYAY